LKIIVANENEHKLVQQFLFAIHELGMIDLMKEEDHQDPHEHFIDSDGYRTLEAAISGEQIKVEVDPLEKRIEYLDN